MATITKKIGVHPLMNTTPIRARRILLCICTVFVSNPLKQLPPIAGKMLAFISLCASELGIIFVLLPFPLVYSPFPAGIYIPPIGQQSVCFPQQPGGYMLF